MREPVPRAEQPVRGIAAVAFALSLVAATAAAATADSSWAGPPVGSSGKGWCRACSAGAHEGKETPAALAPGRRSAHVTRRSGRGGHLGRGGKGENGPRRRRRRAILAPSIPRQAALVSGTVRCEVGEHVVRGARAPCLVSASEIARNERLNPPLCADNAIDRERDLCPSPFHRIVAVHLLACSPPIGNDWTPRRRSGSRGLPLPNLPGDLPIRHEPAGLGRPYSSPPSIGNRLTSVSVA
jgi:hypothetical protein